MSRRKSRRNREPDPFDGILLVDKPSGWTSSDVVVKIRNYFKLRKVGHGGTLDPLATGLLIILIGKGTKYSDQIMGGNKTYEGIIHLGITTDSQDRDGNIIDQKDPSNITRKNVETVIQKYIGDIEQIPPMVSAIKKNGIALYKLARKGQTIERKPRKIHIYRYEIQQFNNPLLHFRVESSKGTYVRTLAHDLGNDLGVGATLDALRRTNSGPFNIAQAHSLDHILTHNRDSLGDLMIHLPELQQTLK